MYEQATTKIFLIKRYHIVLQVVLRSDGVVKVEPYQCRDENLRLWSGIAKTQNVLAQMHLETNKNGKTISVLRSLFQKEGWNISGMDD